MDIFNFFNMAKLFRVGYACSHNFKFAEHKAKFHKLLYIYIYCGVLICGTFSTSSSLYTHIGFGIKVGNLLAH